MNPQRALAQATSYLDEATENLTFDQFAWAFEEAWCGAAWALNALAASPSRLPSAPQLMRAGSLSERLADVSRAPSEGRVVAQLEALWRKLEGADDEAFDFHASAIERLVFDAWELHDACGRRLGLLDDRLRGRLVLTDVSPGRVGSPILDRRNALKLLLAGTVFPLQACNRVERDNRPKAIPAAAKKTDDAPAPTTTVRDVAPLGGMMWQTSDPFLFCAYHVDHYPGQRSDGTGSIAGRSAIGTRFRPAEVVANVSRPGHSWVSAPSAPRLRDRDFRPHRHAGPL
jgi:hypothetical protein